MQHFKDLRTMYYFVITFQIFLILLWLPFMHATREVDVERTKAKQDNTEIDKHFSYKNELPTEKSSIRNDLAKDLQKTIADIIEFNLNGGIEIGKHYSEYQFNKDNMHHHPYDAKNPFHSSSKPNYDYKRKMKSNKERRAVRNVEDETMLNKTDKGMVVLKNSTQVPSRVPDREELSCQEKCVFKVSPRFTCQCDTDCELFKDCCEDYRTYCNQSASTVKLDQQLFCCVKTPDYSPFDSFWAISKCPEDWEPDEIFLKCERIPDEITGDNVRSHVPVISENQTIFYNEYCAKCNNARVLDYFTLNIRSTVRLIPPISATTIEEVVTFALKYGQDITLSIAPKGNQKVRKCSHNDSKRACVVGSGKSGAVIGDVIKDLPPKFVTFSLAMDFRSKTYSSPIISCQRGPFEQMTYDSLLKICRRIEFVKNKSKKNINKYRVVIWLKMQSHPANIKDKDLIASLEVSFAINSSDVLQLRIENVPPDKFAVSFELVLSNEQILTLAKKSQPLSLITEQRTLSTGYHGGFVSNKLISLKRLLYFSKEFNITVSNFTYLVFNTISRQLACLNEQKFSPGEYTLRPSGGYYINSTGEIFHERQVISTYHKILTVCKKIIFSNCNETQIMLRPEEYIRFHNLSIYLNRTNRTYDFGEYDMENGSIVACIFFPESVFSKINTNQLMLGTLTLAAFVASIIHLFFVILTCAVFKELRHLPGKNILNLSTSLILSQILWLAAVGHPYTPTVCKVVAIVEHYLFLVSFVAMAIIAFHSRSVFVNKHVSREVSTLKETKTFLKYSAIVWGSPAIFVITCGLLDNQGLYTIYVHEKMQECWFNNEKAQLYFFVLPVGLSLTFNIVFFVLTVVHISRQRAEASILKTSNSTHQHRTNMLCVYVKLSTLMGFSWLFGYFDILVHSTPVFSYLFVIFASLQGIYIAVAFVFNKRVFKLYGELVRKKSAKRRKTNDFSSTLTKCNNTNTSGEARMACDVPHRRGP